MATLVGFEQDPEAPEGAGVFHFDSGASQYAFDPETAAQAGALKARLDAAPDMRVAGPGGGEPANPNQALADKWAAKMQADNEAQFNPQAVVERANAAVAQTVAQNGPPPPPAPTDQLAAGARDVVARRAAEDLMRGTKRVRVPGAPGVDPNKMNAQGVYVPTTATESFESQNALPYSEEAARERLTAQHGLLQAKNSKIDLEQQATENELNRQRAIAPKLAQDAAILQANHEGLMSQYRRERSALQQEIDDYDKKTHIDPDRFFRDKGTFATIGMVIAQGLGAYASAMNGSPNFAFEMVQRGIDRDIAAQKEEIEAGRVSRRNKMAQMMDNYGFDLPQAEAAMKIAMARSAENQAAMFGAEAKLPFYQQQANELAAQFTADAVKSEQAFQAASIGKHTRTVNNAFLQPKAATGGGYTERELTPEEMAARVKLLGGGNAPKFSELEPGQQLSTVQAYGTRRQEFSDSWAALNDYADAMGLRINRQTGQLVDKAGTPVKYDEFTLTGSRDDIPGVGRPSLDRQGAHRIQEARAKAAAQTGKALSGASVSPQQAEYIDQYLLGGNDDAAAVRGLQRAIASMNDVERDVDATFPDEARAEYDRRAKKVTAQRKQAPKPVEVKDY